MKLPEYRSYHHKPCPYCEYDMIAEFGPRHPTKDHMLPRSRGGSLSAKNKIFVCAKCNHNKGDMTLLEFRDYLSITNDPRYFIVARLVEKKRRYLSPRDFDRLIVAQPRVTKLEPVKESPAVERGQFDHTPEESALAIDRMFKYASIAQR